MTEQRRRMLADGLSAGVGDLAAPVADGAER